LEQEPNKIVIASELVSESESELVKKKQNLDSYEPFIRQMLIYIRQIGFKEKPDYKYLIDCLQRLM
jgi:hypothetical protein